MAAPCTPQQPQEAVAPAEEASSVAGAVSDLSRSETTKSDFVEDESHPDFVEVFVGGLPSDVTQEEVTETFSTVGEVLCVRLNRRKKTGECKGFGFVRYRDQLTAEVACRDIKEVNGKEVGVHISRPRENPAAEEAVLLAGLDSEGGINKLLRLIHTHPDRKAAIAAAIKAVMAQAPRRNGHRQGSMDGLRSGDDLLNDPSLPDPNTFLDGYSKCKQLVERFRENPNTANKTPLAILHEYATRLNLELQYEQSAESNLGPFTTGAKLTSPGGEVNYAYGEGRGRSKKEAKQVTAAAVLENLLDAVPMDNFLQSAKKVILRGPNLPSGRGAAHMRGRGRGRAPIGRYDRRGGSLDYLASLGFPAAQNQAFNLALSTPNSSLQQAQALSPHEALRSLQGSNNAQRLRSYLAGQPSEMDMLSNMRGHSLDTLTSNLQRQLAAGGPITDVSLGVYGNSRSFDNSGFTSGSQPHDLQQQDALLRQRQAQYQQQLSAVHDPATLQNLAQSNANLFNPQAFQAPIPSAPLPFQRY